MNDASATLFDRMGGESGLARLVDELYQRLLEDDHLGEYFMGVDVDRLKATQGAFLRRTFGDTEAVYQGARLRDAHKDLLVTEHAFDRFIDVFLDVARDAGVSEPDQAEIRAALKSMRASVITEFQPNPAYDYKSKPF